MRKKLQIIFSQTMMISTAILFGVGVQMLIYHLAYGTEDLHWPWYLPLTFVFSGFLCALPTMALLYDDEISAKQLGIREAIHFVLVGVLVSLCGYLFQWYETVAEYIPILIMYVVIYFFVWIATIWLMKRDEKMINAALEEIRDEE
ncbi:MAG: DUF3021 domain-containing protein [Lachnospiraceae bacterium]|nr:DUF3021 domain-containing protein [Lachnospiraceae bacterium]